MQPSIPKLCAGKPPGSIPGRMPILLSAFCIAAYAGLCQAADSFTGLGGSFRPSAAPEAAAAPASGVRPGANTAGLRVVLSSRSRSIASIDGQIVHVGDTVNGMRVKQIDQQGVLLVGEDGARERLEMNPLAVKRQRPVPARGSIQGVGP